MPNMKLTGAILDKLRPQSGESRTKYFDSQYGGLCLRVGQREKAWCYFYRFDGKLQYDTLGKYAPGRIDHMDRAAAIAAMGQIDQRIEQGIDPKGKAKSEPVKAMPTTANPNAFHRRVAEFLTWYEISPRRKGGELRSKATVNQARRLLTDQGRFHYLEPLAHSDVGSISRKGIIDFLGDLSENPFQANRIHAYLEIFFGWCWDREYCDPSPMAGLKKQYAEPSRVRKLNTAEIKALWKGCIELDYPWGDLCRFTLATGQRPGECRRLSHDDLHDSVWLVEGGDPKNRERHRIPLPSIARDIVKHAPKFTDEHPFVFTTTGGKKPVGQGGKPYTLLKKKAGFDDWQPRDLRRTFITMASEELDIDNQLIGAICNQTSVSKPGVAGIYNKAEWIRQKGEALEEWNRYLRKITRDKPAAKVTPIRRRARS